MTRRTTPSLLRIPRERHIDHATVGASDGNDLVELGAVLRDGALHGALGSNTICFARPPAFSQRLLEPLALEPPTGCAGLSRYLPSLSATLASVAAAPLAAVDHYTGTNFAPLQPAVSIASLTFSETTSATSQPFTRKACVPAGMPD